MATTYLENAIRQGIDNCYYVVKDGITSEQLYDKNRMICEGFASNEESDDEPPERCKKCIFNQFYEG